MSVQADRPGDAARLASVADPDSTRRGVETRHAIDRAATELFFRLGYHATSMRAIAAGAHVQAAAIYHWYPTKESILVHLQDEFMRELTEAVELAVSRQRAVVARLAAAVRAHVLFHGRHQSEAFVTDSEIRALTGPARTALIAQRDAYQKLFRDMIAAGVDEGAFDPADVDVATYAVLLQCTGVALWFSSEGSITIDDIADYHVDLVLGALHTKRNRIGAAIGVVRAAQREADSGFRVPV